MLDVATWQAFYLAQTEASNRGIGRFEKLATSNRIFINTNTIINPSWGVDDDDQTTRKRCGRESVATAGCMLQYMLNVDTDKSANTS